MRIVAWGTFGLIACGVTLLPARQDPRKDDDALEHARQILRSTPLIDGHNDLPWSIREYRKGPGDLGAYDLRTRTPGQTDLGRLREGMVGAQFWSVYIPGEPGQGFARVQLEQIDLTRRMIDRYPDVFSLALTAEDIEHAFTKHLIASLLGIEGGHAIENSLGALRAYYALGVRYMTLTHNVTLAWADAALDTARHDGLTSFGKEVVREMNRLGMLVDLSHVSPRVMSDALDVSEAPVIFSHSCARALTAHVRNVPDSILVRMRMNGGVIMVTFVPEFVSQEVADWEGPLHDRLTGHHSREMSARIRREYVAEHPMPRAALRHVADHIDYVVKVAGHDNVGIGSDFEGSDDMPEGLEDVSGFPRLFAELIRRGWSDSDLAKLAGQNILRVMREAETVGQRLRKLRPPSRATLEELDGPKK